MKRDGANSSMQVMGVTMSIGDEPCQSHRSTSMKSFRRSVASVQGLETKSDPTEQHSCRSSEDLQQLRMNHDSKHREIDTEVKAKDPRRAMEQVLELDEAIETVRWSSRPCEGRPEGSGRTQEQPALLVSIPNRRRIQDRRRTKSVCRRLKTCEGATS